MPALNVLITIGLPRWSTLPVLIGCLSGLFLWLLRYKLSKFLESKGIAVKDQIGAIDYAADGTGGFKKFGETRIRIDEFERTKRRDLGDQTIVSDDVVGRTKKLLDCY